MELKNKILVGGALCGALALNTEYAKQADEILKNPESDLTERQWAENAKAESSIAGMVMIGGVVVGLGKLLAKKMPGAYDLPANDAPIAEKEVPFTVEVGNEDGEMKQVYANAAALKNMQRGR
ncbi:MAG: hypothetical protein IJ479_07620 [Alphaproteobacteria bacterium]|nr:hypothetical protein [Alphaproteobacteria bacterium]